LAERLPATDIAAVFEFGGTTVVPPETFATSPFTPGGLCVTWALIVVFVKAFDGVKVGPEVIVSVPAKAGLARHDSPIMTAAAIFRRRIILRMRPPVIRFTFSFARVIRKNYQFQIRRAAKP